MSMVIWKSTLSPRFSCTERLIPCKPIVVCVLPSDCREKQEKILRQLEEKRCSLEADKAKLIDSICTTKVEELVEE